MLRAQRPDGYTLLFGTTSDMVVTPIANKAAGYSAQGLHAHCEGRHHADDLPGTPGPERDAASTSWWRWPSRSRAALTLGTTGNASLQAFAAVSLMRAAGIELLTVPYKGGAPIMNDLLGGQLDLAITSAMPQALPQVRGGKLVMLGLLTEQRNASAPEQPTVNESKSVKGVSVEIWAALAGPPKLPPAIVETLNRAVQDVLRDKDYSERRAKLGDMPVPPASAADFARFVASEEDAVPRPGHRHQVRMTVAAAPTATATWIAGLRPHRRLLSSCRCSARQIDGGLVFHHVEAGQRHTARCSCTACWATGAPGPRNGPAFSARFRAISLQPPLQRAQWQPPAFASPLGPGGSAGPGAALLPRWCDEPAVLVGSSYGAYTALAYALDHPERVRALVLLEPPMLRWADFKPPKLPRRTRVLLRPRESREPARRAFVGR